MRQLQTAHFILLIREKKTMMEDLTRELQYLLYYFIFDPLNSVNC
jgi:hypothetical protein